MFWFVAFLTLAVFTAWLLAASFGMAVLIGWQLDIKWRFWKPKPKKLTKREALVEELIDAMYKKMREH